MWKFFFHRKQDTNKMAKIINSIKKKEKYIYKEEQKKHLGKASSTVATQKSV